MSSSNQKPYLLHAEDLVFEAGSHGLNPKVHREQVRLGDLTGLTKTAVHLIRLPPNNESTVLHWHNNDEEWVYILSAGKGAVMCIKEGKKDVKEEPLKDGDFFAFRASSKIAHSMKSGEGEVVYLVGGSREVMDVCYYPQIDMRLVVDRTGDGLKTWVVPENVIL
ncbi:hypothetical protein NEOLEDRAFT_1183840 [Neolentinus lepideus HHB14362 ss-1]|uniref:Uncharacterized protein n=1 Tax=Neolentinus lepideus HHB14362 ss-1 TaxID=1314782 RepID=A0A165MYA3_9AGAM|nr:hypothetical protein NEOLEDRAFT_1183840 [Neolentinus lepideus HHB14362 ss-1]